LTSDEFRIITNNLHLNSAGVCYKHDLVHLKEYVLSAFLTVILRQSLLTWLTDSNIIRVLAFDNHLICSEYGIKNNMSQIKKFVCLRLAYCLSVLNMDRKHDSQKRCACHATHR